MHDKMPHDIRPRDTKGTRSVLVDHELSGVIVGQTLATAPEAYRALLEATAFGTRIISTCGSPRAANIETCDKAAAQAEPKLAPAVLYVSTMYSTAAKPFDIP